MDCGFVKPPDSTVRWFMNKNCNVNRGIICQRDYVAPTIGPSTTPVPVVCPNNWVAVLNRSTCIRLYDQPPSTWSEARDYCKNVQSDLVKIDDGAMQSFVANQISQQKGVYWIGLHDRNKEGFYEWLDEAVKANYTSWMNNRPNNGGGAENCAAADGNHNSNWDDYSCQNKRRFICQRPPLGGTRPPSTGSTSPPSANCGAGWEDDPNTDSCYQLNLEPLTWLDAREQCQRNGGDLAAITSIQEQFYLTARLVSFDSDLFWTGANDRASENGFNWINGAPFAFLNWDDKQPDNSHNSDCVVMTKPSGKWDDLDCNARNAYICEKKGKTTFTPLPTTTPPAHIPAGMVWSCPRGWDNYRGSCYLGVMDTQGIDQLTANAKCGASNMGGTLVSITDDDENKFITSLIPQGYNESVWIGLSDQLMENTFMWVDSAPVTYTNWKNGQPDNNNNEDCVVMKKDGRWYDFDCSNQAKFYICKRSKSILPRDSAQETVGCYNGSLGFGAKCYSFVETPMDYNHAEQDCKAKAGRGKIGHLATIDNSQLQGFLAAELDLQPSAAYWIGLRQSGGSYVNWISSTPVNFVYWGRNHTGLERGTCAIMERIPPVGQWGNVNCNTNMPYICEAPRDGFTTPGPSPSTIRPGGCPRGWNSPRNSSFCFMAYQNNVTDMLSWTEARDFCAALAPEGNLVTITDSYLENWLLTTVLNGVNTSGTFWIGLNDRDTEKSYQWVDDSPFLYSNWMDGQPDDVNNREDCVQWILPDNKWMDDYCPVSYNWICQIPRGSRTPTTTVAPTGVISAQCDNSSWIEYNKNCYFISPDDAPGVSWFDARVACRTLGADLLSIGGPDENSFITSLISKTATSDRWIGLNDLDGTYEWTDLSFLTYISWAPNEPNDAYGGERCVETVNTGQWNDLHCQSQIGYICKKRPGDYVPVTRPPPSTLGGCPSGFSSLPTLTSCYKVAGATQNSRLNFDDATNACKAAAHGGSLAAMHSPLDSKFVTTMVAGVNVWHNSALWIGLNDRRIRNSFEWLDNTAVDYVNWGPGQPNENLNSNDPSQRRDCVSLVAAGNQAGLWRDRACSLQLAYVCGVPKNPSLPAVVIDTSGCQKGYRRFLSSCYKFFADSYTWGAAQGTCKAEGGNLASINSRAEQAFVEIVTGRTDDTQFWIGLKYEKIGSIYQWSDNWPVSYTNWGHNEPDNSDVNACATHMIDAKWQSLDCNLSFPFVCEQNLGTMPPPRGNVGQSQCPDKSWYNRNGYCYLIEKTNLKTWAGANYACSLLGASLASIHQDDEAQFLTPLIGRSGQDLWIGLSKGQGVGFTWSDGSEVEYFLWGVGEPSDPDSFLHEDCVRVDHDSGTWGDVDCSDEHGYICKRQAVGPSGTPPKQGGLTQAPITQQPPVTGNQQPPVTGNQQPPVTGKQHGSQPSDSGSNVGGGAIAGIVLGVLAFIALGGVGGFFLFRRYRSSDLPKSALSSTAPGFENASYSSRKKESVSFSTA